ncbi:MAG TPA: ATP-grasp domain-containing protein [Isosphaeraceae bacterium]|nr:ATP-grasp domain-containing protein [Isosphaeraceae bacterium]
MIWKGDCDIPNQPPRTVLIHEWVTGGGLSGSTLPASWAAEGRAMRRSIAADFAALPKSSVRVVVTLDVRLPHDPGPWQTEPIAPGNYADRLRALARAADFTVLIAPETSGILAGLTRDLTAAGARLLGSTALAVELAADKACTAARLEELSISTPPTRTIVPSAGLPSDTEYPAVLKPVDGAGSLDTFYLSDALSLPPAALAMPRAVLQPFVPGTPMSASFLVGPAGKAWLIGVGIQRVAVRDGRFQYLGGTLPAACPEAVPQLTKAVEAFAGLHGFVGVDFIWNEARQHAMILEINPRPTTSYVGIGRLLPAGLLARAWLTACEALEWELETLAGLAENVHAKPVLSFQADGELIDRDSGAFRS